MAFTDQMTRTDKLLRAAGSFGAGMRPEVKQNASGLNTKEFDAVLKRLDQMVAVLAYGNKKFDLSSFDELTDALKNLPNSLDKKNRPQVKAVEDTLVILERQFKALEETMASLSDEQKKTAKQAQTQLQQMQKMVHSSLPPGARRASAVGNALADRFGYQDFYDSVFAPKSQLNQDGPGYKKRSTHIARTFAGRHNMTGIFDAVFGGLPGGSAGSMTPVVQQQAQKAQKQQADATTDLAKNVDELSDVIERLDKNLAVDSRERAQQNIKDRQASFSEGNDRFGAVFNRRSSDSVKKAGKDGKSALEETISTMAGDMLGEVLGGAIGGAAGGKIAGKMGGRGAARAGGGMAKLGGGLSRFGTAGKLAAGGLALGGLAWGASKMFGGDEGEGGIGDLFSRKVNVTASQVIINGNIAGGNPGSSPDQANFTSAPPPPPTPSITPSAPSSGFNVGAATGGVGAAAAGVGAGSGLMRMLPKGMGGGAATGLGRLLGPLAVVLQGQQGYQELEALYNARQAGQLTEAQFKKQFTTRLGGILGGASGGLILGQLGAMGGGALGSVVPGAGTFLGGAVGGIVGGTAGFMGGDKVGSFAAEKLYDHVFSGGQKTTPTASPTSAGGSAPATPSAANGAPIKGGGKGGPSHAVAGYLNEASSRFGVNSQFMYQTAKRESNFNETVKAGTSSATGLFQFTSQTWLQQVKQHGAEIGLGQYADLIYKGKDGKYRVKGGRDQEVLDLRKSGRYNALLGATLTRDNVATLARVKDPSKITAADAYAAHFLGAGGASKLLRLLQSSPHSSAADHFPDAARANRSIFYSRGRAVTIKELYDNLSKKHGTYSVLGKGAPVAGSSERASNPEAARAASVEPSSAVPFAGDTGGDMAVAQPSMRTEFDYSKNHVVGTTPRSQLRQPRGPLQEVLASEAKARAAQQSSRTSDRPTMPMPVAQAPRAAGGMSPSSDRPDTQLDSLLIVMQQILTPNL